MAFPGYEDIEDPLLCLIYCRGGSAHEILAGDAYAPLADHFGLTQSERAQLRDDRDEPHWNNMVQWARRKLKDRGYLAPAPHGVWRLSQVGIDAAKRYCG